MPTPPGRTICGKCGANNFETQAACWKCGTPLGASGTSSPPSGESPRATDAGIAPTIDPSVAHWVGIIGGLTVPIAMLPVGLAFLMWGDRQKVDAGRTATIASLVGTLLHAVVTYFAVAGLVGAGMKLLPGAAERAKAAQTEPAPNFGGDAEPLDLGGVRPMAPAK